MLGFGFSFACLEQQRWPAPTFDSSAFKAFFPAVLDASEQRIEASAFWPLCTAF